MTAETDKEAVKRYRRNCEFISADSTKARLLGGNLLDACTRLEAANEEIEQLKKRRGGECQECGSWVCPPLTCFSCLAGKSLDSELRKINGDLTAKIEQQQAELDKHCWIPVSDPPKTGIYVFIAGAVNGYVSNACYNKEKDYWQRYGAKIKWTITHWMPIILPPKESK